MKLMLNVSEDCQLIIPADQVKKMDLKPGAAVEVEIRDSKPHTFDPVKWEQALAELETMRPAFQKRLHDDGYASVDELMADLRPEW